MTVNLWLIFEAFVTWFHKNCIFTFSSLIGLVTQCFTTLLHHKLFMFNLFQPNFSFLYPLKTSKNLRFLMILESIEMEHLVKTG